MGVRVAMRWATLACAVSGAPSAAAAELIVRVSGMNTSAGEVGCALFKGREGFPMNPAVATQQWLAASAKGVECRFAGLSAGEYAVSVSHDLNGNRAVDTNFVGIPTEAWGVSNNARPMLRAPKWHEAAFQVEAGKDLALDIRVSK